MELFSPLELPFMRLALVAGLLAGGACAFVGIHLILKRIVFVGAALSEIAAAGLALGLLVQGPLGLDRGSLAVHFPGAVAFLFTFLGIVLFWLPYAERKVSRESLIGYAYAAAAALAVLIVSKNPGGALQDLDLLSGQLLFVDGGDVLALALAAGAVILMNLLWWKEFLFVSLDPVTAQTLGIPARMYDFLLYLSIGTIISVSTRRVGVLFVFASLILPALTGLLLARRMPSAVLLSLACAGMGVLTGLLGSFHLDLPTGPSVVLAYAGLFLLAVLGKGLARLV